MRPQRKLSCYLNLQHLHTAEQNFLHMMTLATQKIRETHSRPDNNIEGLFKRLALVGSLNDQLDAVMNAWQWGPDNPESIYKPRHATGHDSRFDLAQIVRSEEEQFCQVVQLAIQQIQAVPAEDEPNFNNHFLLRYMVIGWITMQTEAALTVWDELTPPSMSYPPSVRRQSEQPQPQPSPPRIPPEVPMQTGPDRSSKPPSKHHPPPPPKPNTYINSRVPTHEQSQGNLNINHPPSPRHIRHLSSSHMEIAGHRMPRSLPAPDSQHHEHSGSHSIDPSRRPLKRSRNEEPPGEPPTKSSMTNHGHPPATRTFRPPPPLPVLVRSPETIQGPSSPTRPPNHDGRSAHPDPQSSPKSTASTGSATISQQPTSRTESRHPTRTNSTESTNQEKSAPRPSAENSGANKSALGVCKFAYPYSVRGARTHAHCEEIPQSNRAKETRTRDEEDRCQYENDTTPTGSDSSRQMAIDSPPEQSPPDATVTMANGVASGSK